MEPSSWGVISALAKLHAHRAGKTFLRDQLPLEGCHLAQAKENFIRDQQSATLLHGKRAEPAGGIRVDAMAIDGQGGVSGKDREDRDAAGNLVPPEWVLKETRMMTAFFPALATRAPTAEFEGRLSA